MKNLEQVRAAAALKAVASDLYKEGVSKLPSLILNNGLLATAAFCDAASEDGNNRSVMRAAMEAVVRHLAEQKLATSGSGKLADRLAAEDSIQIQRATMEALAFLSYLKRFAPSKNKS